MSTKQELTIVKTPKLVESRDEWFLDRGSIPLASTTYSKEEVTLWEDFKEVKQYLKEQGYDVLDDNEDTRRISLPKGRQTERLQRELERKGISYTVKTRR